MTSDGTNGRKFKHIHHNFASPRAKESFVLNNTFHLERDGTSIVHEPNYIKNNPNRKSIFATHAAQKSVPYEVLCMIVLIISLPTLVASGN